MDVIIIGGSGNISSPLPALLHAAGLDVAVLNRGSTPAPTGVTQIIADATQPDALIAALKANPATWIIDFCAFTPEQVSARLAALEHTAGRYLFISSATVYAKPHQTLPLREDHPLGNPHSAYAQAKQACESAIQAAALPHVIVRPSHTLGTSWIPSPLSGSDWTIAARILAGKPVLVPDDGTSLWTLTASEDLCAALTGMVMAAPPDGTVVHITADEPLTWNTIYQEIGNALGREPLLAYRPAAALAEASPQALDKLLGDKSHHAVFDNQAIKRLVPDWHCQFRPHQLIQRAVAWRQADPSRQSVDPTQDALIDTLLATVPPTADRPPT